MEMVLMVRGDLRNNDFFRGIKGKFKMNKLYSFAMFLVLSCFVIGLSSCICCIQGDCCDSKVQREFILETEMADGMIFSAETRHGFIHVTGTEEKRCHVTANVHVWAKSIEEANEIAEKVKVEFQKSTDHISVVVEKPPIQNNCGVFTDYEVKLPKNTHLVLKTTHDTIRCENIEGNITASTTHDPIECCSIIGNLKLNTTHGEIVLSHIKGGVEASTTHDPIKAEYVTGPVNLGTTHGRVVCKEIDTNRLRVRTSHDNVSITFKDGVKGQVDADIKTSHGDIVFNVPVDFEGDVCMSTTHGRLRSDIPMVVKGEISGNMVSGTVGEGAGKINLKTTHGSITLK